MQFIFRANGHKIQEYPREFGNDISKHSCASKANSPENSITVTIPYLGDEVYAQDTAAISSVVTHDAPVNVQDKIENVPVIGLDAQDNVQDNMQETLSNVSV